jgi:hypothetical protein
MSALKDPEDDHHDSIPHPKSNRGHATNAEDVQNVSPGLQHHAYMKEIYFLPPHPHEK